MFPRVPSFASRINGGIDPRIPYFYKTWYRIPFLVPAWGREELRAVWAFAMSSGDDGGKATEALAKALEDRFSSSHVVLTSTGRFAIEVALRSLDKPGAEVIIPTFSCGAIPEAILQAGYVPVFADINADLTLSVESVRANLTERTVAVLVAHLSGKPASDLDELVELCHERGIPLIDDAAQAIGVKHRGEYLGSFGDFGILSFGVGKPTFSVGGGALILRSSEVKMYCKEIVDQIGREARSHPREVVAAWNFLLEYCWRRATQPIYLLGRAVKKIVGISGPKPHRGRISRLSALIQLKQINKLDKILTGFAANGRYIIRRLADRAEVAFPQSSEDCAYTKLILALRKGDPGRMAKHLLKHGIEVEWSYKPLDLLPKYSPFRRFRNFHAEAVWNRLLALPAHPRLHGEEIEVVASAVEKYFHSK